MKIILFSLDELRTGEKKIHRVSRADGHLQRWVMYRKYLTVVIFCMSFNTRT